MGALKGQERAAYIQARSALVSFSPAPVPQLPHPSSPFSPCFLPFPSFWRGTFKILFLNFLMK